jgi:hypothetical protein
VTVLPSSDPASKSQSSSDATACRIGYRCNRLSCHGIARQTRRRRAGNSKLAGILPVVCAKIFLLALFRVNIVR